MTTSSPTLPTAQRSSLEAPPAEDRLDAPLFAPPGQRLEVQYVPVDELRPDPRNPRRISDAELEKLTRSIRLHGLTAPILARRADRMIIGGHQRAVAARRVGLATVPVIYLDCSVDQARALNLALNRISGTFDDDLLAQLLRDLAQTVDVTVSGFGEDEVRKLLRRLESRARSDQLEDFDLDAELGAARGSGRVQRGQVWRLGDHRLMCGDAADADDVALLMDGRQARMCFTDPPYNVGFGDHGGQQPGSRRRRIQNDSLPPDEWEAFVRAFAANLLRHVDGALYICMGTGEFPLMAQVLAGLGAHWSDMIVWAKDHFVLGRADYQRAYEPIWYGWRDGSKRHWCGDRDQSNVWEIRRPITSPLHPMMKPVELVQRAIENSSEPGDLMVDLFIGSGSSIIAAERSGRTCYGLELVPHYCDVAIARWERFTEREAVCES